MAESLHPVTAIYTDVRPHPSRSGWGVLALVTTQLGNVLYISRDHWALEESARIWNRDVLDGRIADLIAAANEAAKRGEIVDLFGDIEALELLERAPTIWAPQQFDAL